MHPRYMRARCARPTCIRYFVGPLCTCILTGFAGGAGLYAGTMLRDRHCVRT